MFSIIDGSILDVELGPRDSYVWGVTVGANWKLMEMDVVDVSLATTGRVIIVSDET